jgi:hypothetical protein
MSRVGEGAGGGSAGRRPRTARSYAALVEYAVSVDVRPAAGAPVLDALQTEGAASLLGRVLDEIESAQSESDEVVDLDDYWVGAHPEGAVVLLHVDADSLPAAEAAGRDILVQVLDRTKLLADWRVTRCEVELSAGAAEAALNEDDDGLPPADPAERARWLAEQAEPATSQWDDDTDWHAWTLGHAGLLRAFELDVFVSGDDEDEETARLAAGALIFAVGLVIDELFQDLESLGRGEGDNVADSTGVFFVLEDLPQRFAQHYTVRFVHRFLAATVMITGRLAQDQWASPACVAEALALHIVVARARAFIEEHELLEPEDIRALYHGFDDAAFDDVDHELLYRQDLDGFEDDAEFSEQFRTSDMRVESWFEQCEHSEGHVHTYVTVVEAPAIDKDEEQPFKQDPPTA